MFATTLVIVVFVIGYLGIVFEHPLRIDKTAPALFAGMMSWAVLALYGADIPAVAVQLEEFAGAASPFLAFLDHELAHHLYEISNILFFLLGAMTIVEVVDLHDGFYLLTSRIRTTSKRKLLLVVSLLTFFLSALLDNLTTTIVMVSLLNKMVEDRKLRLLYAGAVVIAANAGGAWSPIGDVTTTMLWIGHQISVTEIVFWLLIPSLVALLVPMFLLGMSRDLRGQFQGKKLEIRTRTTPRERAFVFFLGTGSLLAVPVFKTVTHLPPFMGMLLGLGFLWAATERLHKQRAFVEKRGMSVVHALTNIDAASVLFFLGILLAVACLQTIGVLGSMAGWLGETVGNYDVIVMIIGILSAVVDNVPLVAAAQGMYPVIDGDPTFAMDGKFWQFLAYCAGTGGSTLIIGSAAGVAAMGIEKIDFIWYLKRFAWLALAGYFAGAFTYLGLYAAFGP